MDHDFGKRLTQARLARGLTVEEAAQGTRMRPGLVRALEDSNLTQFPNAAYAKSFLLMYAKYLGIDMKGVAGTIDTSTQMRVEDFQYLTSLASEEKRLQKEASADPRYDFVVARKQERSWLPLILAVIAGAIGLVVFIVTNTLHRFEATKPTPAPQVSATPAPAATGTSTDAMVPDKAVVTAPTPVPHPDVAVAPSIPTPPPGSQQNGAPVPAVPTPPPTAGNSAAAPPTVAANVPTAAPAESPTQEETTSGPMLPPGTVILEPVRKTWVTIRTGPGGQPLYEDYLYPTAKPMHLPAGKYFIELREADAVEISKDGKSVPYSVPGVMVD